MPSLIRKILVLSLLLLTSNLAGAQLIFGNLPYEAIEIIPWSSTGLDYIYVVPQIAGATVGVEGTDASWVRFSAMGGAYGEPAASTVSGSMSQLIKPEGNVGYAVTVGGKTRYYWIIDHSAYPFALRDISLDRTESDCSTAYLTVDGEGERLPYYSITGAPQWLSRDLRLTYQTLEFDEENFQWVQVEKTESIEGFSDETTHCDAPLCQTDFTLEGDRFMRQWGLGETVTSPVYDPWAVEVRSRAVQLDEEHDNQVRVDAALGGSGPAEISFQGAVTDAAIFHEWELARDSEFNQVFMRSTDLDFTYNFREFGTVYARLNVANEDASCETSGDSFEVFIGESQLKCPNAFSPGASEGINDEWKVSYKSIIEFDCYIFDRHGRQLAHLTEPSQGWDGKRNGKVVGPGVYFYVIRAKGADGRKYNLKGDINVVGHKGSRSSSSSSSNETE